jgi:hypothetical protein
MILELDDDFSDEVTVANLAQSYVSLSDMLKHGKGWHEDDVAAWEEMLPALKTVLKWYCVDVDAEIKKAKKGKKK